MLETVCGVSDALSAIEATESVINQCVDRLRGRIPQAGILFTSCMDADYGAILRRICDTFPGIELAGCTSGGEISPLLGFSEDSVSLLLFCSETVQFKAAMVHDFSSFPERRFRETFATCNDALSGPPACCFIFPDGITTIELPVVDIVRRVCGDIPLIGGAAADHYQFKKAYQFCGTEVSSGGMAMLFVQGNLQINVGTGNGWTPIGPYHSVDRSEGNRIYSIDGMPAGRFYKEYLGVVASAMTHIPLAVYRQVEGRFKLRNSLYVYDDGSVDFMGSIPSGSLVRLTTVFREDIIYAADCANEQVLAYGEGPPDLVLVFCCTSRRHILGSRSDEEFGKLMKKKDVPFFGFYSYGQYAPHAVGEQVLFQNDCYVAVSLREYEQ
ncbi:FIST signal transduction protein [Desulfopila sp. IMCC35008]|uniref:FIST signal transduction protein n=1 Tax=Desulfopila sp. IMCC35008 TaxID=2653858 RepID=UPI0013D87A16|nr:FIST N-terminal domain-containing protein [Desulfopila sp. IMCC35008]